jgi:battenin
LPYWLRPALFTLIWGIAAFVASVTPPNVPPIFRIATVFAASVVAAAGDISWLGQLRSYGKLGLAGWGMGTGLGGIVCAVLPHFLTVGMHRVLRACVEYAWYLAPMLLVAQWIILPKPLVNALSHGRHDKHDDDIDDIEDDTAELLVRDPPAVTLTLKQRFEANWKLFRALTSPYVVQLFWGLAGQAMAYPGFSRSQGISASFDAYPGYLAAYGLSFQLGNFLARSAVLFIRAKRRRTMLAVLAGTVFLLLANTVFMAVVTPGIIFVIVFCAGVAAGTIYVETFSVALEDKIYESEAAREFGLAVIGVGEPGGLILGGILADLVETTLCGGAIDTVNRWCHMTK